MTYTSCRNFRRSEVTILSRPFLVNDMQKPTRKSTIRAVETFVAANWKFWVVPFWCHNLQKWSWSFLWYYNTVCKYCSKGPAADPIEARWNHNNHFARMPMAATKVFDIFYSIGSQALLSSPLTLQSPPLPPKRLLTPSACDRLIRQTLNKWTSCWCGDVIDKSRCYIYARGQAGKFISSVCCEGTESFPSSLQWRAHVVVELFDAVRPILEFGFQHQGTRKNSWRMSFTKLLLSGLPKIVYRWTRTDFMRPSYAN